VAGEISTLYNVAFFGLLLPVLSQVKIFSWIHSPWSHNFTDCTYIGKMSVL